MPIQQLNKLLTSNLEGVSLFNIGINAYGQIRRKKNVSVWTQDTPPREVLVGNILNNKSEFGKVLGETLSRSAVILKADFSDPSKLCTHPTESGAVITDHKVILPKKCNLQISMPAYFQDVVIEEIRQLYWDSTFLTVRDVSGDYSNMVIVNLPHVTDAKTAGRLVFNLEMEQVQVVAPQYVKLTKKQVKNAKNASTVPSGVKQPKQTSILKDLWDKAKEKITLFQRSRGQL